MGGRTRRRGRASLVTLNREDCAHHEETEKPEKGETTGKIIFIWNYTIVVNKIQLIKVYIYYCLASFVVFLCMQ